VAVYAAGFLSKRGWGPIVQIGLGSYKGERCVATVMSSEMGKSFYEAVSFEVKGEFVVRIDGED